MESQGLPGQDACQLPASQRCFPDGAHYRIEIAGVERASAMETLIAEARRRGVPVHRAVATVGGSTFLDAGELKAMAQMAAEAGIEVIATVGPRKSWDPGAREAATSEGRMQGFRLRGADSLSHWIADMMRNIEAGFRGFLVYDEGLLTLLQTMRAQGLIPGNTIFKFSVFAGYANAAGARLAESLGANSLNPVSDVSLPILAGIRRAVSIPLDIYVLVVDSFGGMFRAYEAPEIARVAAPCYFKIEPGSSEEEIYKPWISEDFHNRLIRHKVCVAAVLAEIMAKHAPQMRLSAANPEDLVIPEA
jgi:hypothetical protein